MLYLYIYIEKQSTHLTLCFNLHPSKITSLIFRSKHAPISQAKGEVRLSVTLLLIDACLEAYYSNSRQEVMSLLLYSLMLRDVQKPTQTK